MLKRIKNINLVKLLRLEKLKTPTIITVVLTAFVVVNVLLAVVSLRFDFSNGQAYTLSTSTKKIINKLSDNVTIKFFASSDLPTKIIPVKNEVVDLLNEYQRVNTRKITVKVLDPKKDSNAQRDVTDANLPQLQFSQLESDKYAVTSSYFGIVVSYKDKKEILAQVSDINSLEYNLTAMIYKLTRTGTAKIGIIGKQRSYDTQSGDLNYLSQLFARQFEIGYIDKEIDPSYKTVLVFDTSSKQYSDDELAALKKYIDNGGKMIVFVDGVWVGEGLTASEAKSNLNKLLNNYGLGVKNDLVLSTSAELVNFGNSMVQFLSVYPFWLKTNVFNSRSSYFSNISQLTFPWVSTVAVNNVNGWNTTRLINSTKKSWQQVESSESAIILDPQSIPMPQTKDLKSYVLAAEAKGKSAGEIMVVGSSRFILDKYLSQSSGNLEFILNVVNDYASGGALPGIRQRAVSYYPLPDLVDNQKDIFKYVNIFALPVLFGLIGGFVLFKRR